MSDYCEYDLGAAGFAYIADNLADEPGLAGRLLVSASAGRTFSLLPAGVPADRARRFESGGVADAGRVARELDGVIARCGAAALIMQDVWMHAADLAVFGLADPIIGPQLEVYYAAALPTPTGRGVGLLRRCGASWLQVLIATAHPRPQDLRTAAGVAAVAEAATLVAVSAYDQDSFVIWQPAR